MGLLRRDERGGLQFPEAMDDLPRLGVLTSERMAALKSHAADDDASRAAAARRKLTVLSRSNRTRRGSGA